MIKKKSKSSKYKTSNTNHNSNKKIWLYGFHSVIAAIENTNRKKYRLVCTKNALSKLSNKEILKSTIEGLEKLGFVEEQNIVDTKILTEKYAYIIHDLNCKKNTDTFLSAFKKLGIQSVGRFALFEYLNTDGVVEKSWALADELNNDNL